MRKPALILMVLFLIVNTSCSQDNSTKDQSSNKDVIYFQKVKEPNEGAFELLVPLGWQTKGGIFRLDPTQSGGAGNSIAAKYDFAVYNNEASDVQIRWLPDYLFMDMRNSPAGAFFPEGSNNNGMQVRNLPDPVSFIMQVVLSYAHPNIQDVKKTGQKPLPGIASAYHEHASKTPMLTMSYSAAQVNIEYSENGKVYEEVIVAVIEDWGQMGAGMWGNKSCLYIRAPKGDLKAWASVLETIHTSVVINIPWLIGELKGQQVRGGELIKVQQQIQNIDKDIAAHRQKTNHEIHNDMYLTLTEQEEYINPYTNEIETGSNQWDHRWQNDLGEIIYTDNEGYDPNTDPNMQVSGFKRSSIRKR